MKLSQLFSNYFTVRKELVEAVKNFSQGQIFMLMRTQGIKVPDV
jgi:hypothetical protein